MLVFGLWISLLYSMLRQWKKGEKTLEIGAFPILHGHPTSISTNYIIHFFYFSLLLIIRSFANLCHQKTSSVEYIGTLEDKTRKRKRKKFDIHIEFIAKCSCYTCYYRGSLHLIWSFIVSKQNNAIKWSICRLCIDSNFYSEQIWWIQFQLDFCCKCNSSLKWYKWIPSQSNEPLNYFRLWNWTCWTWRKWSINTNNKRWSNHHRKWSILDFEFIPFHA